jgi:hypothetical protein
MPCAKSRGKGSSSFVIPISMQHLDEAARGGSTVLDPPTYWSTGIPIRHRRKGALVVVRSV